MGAHGIGDWAKDPQAGDMTCVGQIREDPFRGEERPLESTAPSNLAQIA